MLKLLGASVVVVAASGLFLTGPASAVAIEPARRNRRLRGALRGTGRASGSSGTIWFAGTVKQAGMTGGYHGSLTTP